MQTFLPLPDYAASARCLDWRRLGKQRLECRQLLRACASESAPWGRHAATRMWRSHEHHLVLYAVAVCREWRSRGYADSMMLDFLLDERRLRASSSGPPPWLGRADFHASHRGNLLRKDPAHYGQFGWSESADLPYVWP